MRKRITTISTLAVLATLAMGTTLALASEDNAKEEKALAAAKITLSQAIDKALAAVPGKALSAELDDKLSSPAYVIEVLDQGRTYEVTLNTQSGQVIDKQLDHEDHDDHEGDQEDSD